MHNTGSLGGAYVFPWDDRMNDTPRRWKLVEWAAILPAHHITAFKRFHHVVVALVTALEGFQDRQKFLREVIVLAVLCYFDVGQVRVHSRSKIGGQGPGRGCPHQQVLAWPVHYWKAHIQAQVADILVILRERFHVGDAGGAARAPGHHNVSLVDQASLVAPLQE